MTFQIFCFFTITINITNLTNTPNSSLSLCAVCLFSERRLNKLSTNNILVDHKVEQTTVIKLMYSYTNITGKYIQLTYKQNHKLILL